MEYKNKKLEEFEKKLKKEKIKNEQEKDLIQNKVTDLPAILHSKSKWILFSVP
mgnify:CR=1 FL=1